jgi:hypothetical protein
LSAPSATGAVKAVDPPGGGGEATEPVAESGAPETPARNHLARINLVLTTFVSIYAFWMASGGTWNPDGVDKLGLGSEFFYWSQAESLLHGQVYAVTPRQWWLECFTIAGKCYGYFGVGPSIVRIPAVLLFGNNFVGLVPLFVAIGIGLAFWASMDLVRLVLNRYLERNPAVSVSVATRWLIVVGALLGPGSVLVLLARGRVYEEAGVWCAAFLCLTLNLVYRWSTSRSVWCLYGAIATGSMATLSRPSAIPAVIVLGIAVIVIAWRWGGTKVRVLGAGLSILPTALFVIIFVRKFGSLSFPWKTYSPYLVMAPFKKTLVADHNSTVGFRYALTTLANYLRLDSIHFQLSAPWVTLHSVRDSDLIILPTVTRVQIWGNRIPSLTDVMPIPFVFTGIALVHHGRRVIKQKLRGVSLMPAFMLLAGLAGGIPMIMYYAVAGRYLGDVYPLMVVGTAFALPVVLKYSQKDQWMSRLTFPGVAVMAVLSCFVLYQIRGSVF